MEDAHEREARYGQRGAIGLHTPLVEKTYHFVGFDHEEGAVYYCFRNQYYLCTAYLGSLRHDPVDHEEVLAVSSGSMRWSYLDDQPSYTREEAVHIIQQHLIKDIIESAPPRPKQGWFKRLLEVFFG